jgi:hypothetical protein
MRIESNLNDRLGLKMVQVSLRSCAEWRRDGLGRMHSLAGRVRCTRSRPRLLHAL